MLFQKLTVMIKRAPLFFIPYLKSVIWGGDKICRYKGIPQKEPNIGESWEISAVHGHESIIERGQYAGLTLTDLIEKYPEQILGKKVLKKYGAKFPLLIKIIDASDNLSVQVHPDDSLAAERHNSLGKTEMWYIISAGKNAKIYAGLNTTMTAEDYVRRVKDGTFASTLASHESNAGDVFFLPAGRVHAIGAGNLLAEIQESSDVTYRIYDYDRRDSKGNPRELHTELAKDAIDFTIYPEYKSPAPSSENDDCEIVACDHFRTRRILLDGTKKLEFSGDSFTIFMCIDGKAEIETQDETHILHSGQTCLLPAVIEEITIRGKATIIVSTV